MDFSICVTIKVDDFMRKPKEKKRVGGAQKKKKKRDTNRIIKRAGV